MRAWKAYALQDPANERVGFFLKDGTFHPVENKHPEPKANFLFSLADHLDVADQIAGVVHSHPDTSMLSPSKLDMENQIAHAVPWAISSVHQDSVSDPVWWGDQLPIRPLVGRVFLHGINDCFSLIRDWHRLQGIHFQDFPRNNRWWEEDPPLDMYETGFKLAGFERVYRSSPKKGDVFMCSLHSDQRNHGGVFVCDQELLHHPGQMLSQRSLGVRWRSKLDFLVRHKDLPEDF